METNRFKNWWFLAINGLIFTLMGLLFIFFTQEAILVMIKYFGIGLLALGVILLLAGLNQIRKDRDAAMLLVEAISSGAIGLALLIFPSATLALFLILVGIWAVIVGIIQIVVIVNIKAEIPGKNIHLFNAILTIGLGIMLLFNPFGWAVFMGKVIGVMSVLFGVVLLYFAFVLRGVKSGVQKQV